MKGMVNVKIFLMLFISSFILFGCTGKEEQSAQSRNNQAAVNVKNSTFQHVDRQTGQQISKHLTDLATSIPKVNDATTVVLGRFAIVE